MGVRPPTGRKKYPHPVYGVGRPQWGGRLKGIP